MADGRNCYTASHKWTLTSGPKAARKTTAKHSPMPYLIGTDEAGYGPNLGPLVISTTAWRLPDDGLGAWISVTRRRSSYVRVVVLFRGSVTELTFRFES